MKFSVEWLQDANNAAPWERATVADVRLWLGRFNATAHFVEESHFDHITIAAYGLAEGLATDWWTLFGGRDRPLSLTRYRCGYIVPDIRFSFDGANLEVRAEERSYIAERTTFQAISKPDIIPRDEAERTLGDFVEEVLARLTRRNLGETGLALRWDRVQSSRGDPDETAFCEAAGALGLDPYRISDQAAAVIEQAAAFFTGEALIEFLAGNEKIDRNILLSWVKETETRPRYKSRLPELGPAAAETACSSPVRDGEKSWELGYRRARTFRSKLNIGQEGRFRSISPLTQRLGASNFRPAPPIDGIRALRSNHDGDVHIHLRDHGSGPISRASGLFSLARAIGDAVCFPEPARAPVNELVDARRQAAGRAFAAEFLAPIDEISAMQEDGRDIVTVANEFGVSTEVVHLQIRNRERISHACAAIGD